MCSAYPQRRNELDLYERDIDDMATGYSGRGFYEYHRQFSLQAAAHLLYNNIMVDWSVRNNLLFCNIFANLKPNTCNHCNSTLHLSGLCPSIVQKGTVDVHNIQGYKNNKSEFAKDSYGRSRVYHFGKEICNNFNGDRGCKAFRCNNLRMQEGSLSTRLSIVEKRGRAGANQLKKEANRAQHYDMSVYTPVNVDRLKYELHNHPDLAFTEYLIQGFHTGFQNLPTFSIECKNLVSAISRPDCVTNLIDNEIRKGYLCGRFDTIPFQHFRINPIGVAESRYSKKKRNVL